MNRDETRLLRIRQRAVGRRLPPTADWRPIRLGARVSQVELADLLGVHRLTVHRWERGLRQPRGRLAQLYAQALAAMAADS